MRETVERKRKCTASMRRFRLENGRASFPWLCIYIKQEIVEEAAVHGSQQRCASKGRFIYDPLARSTSQHTRRDNI